MSQKCSPLDLQNKLTQILWTKPKKETFNTIFRRKKVLNKEILIDYSFPCMCNVSVMEFWTKFNKWYASWIQDVAIKWSQVWALFFNFSQNPIRDQEIFTVLIVVVAADSFCSSFCHQEKPKQPSYISLWNALLRIVRLPIQVVSVMITQPPCLRRNLALLCRSKA